MKKFLILSLILISLVGCRSNLSKATLEKQNQQENVMMNLDSDYGDSTDLY